MSAPSIYRIPLRIEEEQRETRQAVEHLRSSSAFKPFVQWLDDRIAAEREVYESTTADEYRRGHLNALTDLRRVLTGG